MQPTDLALLAVPSDPRLSPDAATVAFVVTTVDLDKNQYRAAVWTVPTDGLAAARRLTAGAERDGRPRWSPDGRSLAFTSHREDVGSQLFVLPIGGGEPGAIVSLPEEIEDVEWSPDGRWLAFLARRRDEAIFSPPKDADRPPRRVTRLGWKFNGTGWLCDRPRCLWIVPADGTAPARVVVDGGLDVQLTFCWAPDSARIAFTQGRHDDADIDGVIDVWSVDHAAGDIERLTDGSWSCGGPSWSPNGALVAYYRSRPLETAANAELRLRSLVDGTDRLVEEVAALDRGRATISPGRPVWRGSEVLHAVEDQGGVHVYRTSTGIVIGGNRVVTGFDADPATLVATVAEPTVPGALIALDDTGAERVLASFPARFPTQTPERFLVPATGGVEVEAFLIRPVGFDPAGRYPVLVNIHGGPYAQYGHGFMDEFQVQAAAGYAVLYCNPRGSGGYGAAWGRAIRGPKCDVDPGSGWGGVDAEDIHAMLDTALASWDFLDTDRVGVLGGSYGGYLTSWLVGHTDRFKAACSERAVNNVLSMTHTSDIGWWFNTGYAGVGAQDPMELLRISPVTYADAITTPLLILHSENDFRCPMEQAEDLFLRLRRRGHDVEMVRFPGEDHELSRSGAPKHRLQRFEIILEFFAKHLTPRQ